VLRVAAGAGHLLKTPFNVSLLAAQLVAHQTAFHKQSGVR